MAQRIVKCPSGKYAAFSEIVDDFVAYDMTREEALKFCVDEWDLGPKASEEKVHRADENPHRYEEAMDVIAHVHGKRERTKREAEIN